MCVLRRCVSTLGLLLLLLPVSLAQTLSRYPGVGSVYGVFQASRGGYSFNVSSARLVCDHMGVVIATKAQVDQARRHGLHTCRFGWVDEQVAVLPRVSASPQCGQNNTGLVLWRAALNTLFDVFCYNHTDLELQLIATMTTMQPITTQSPDLDSSPLPLDLDSSPPHLLSLPTADPVEKTLTSTGEKTSDVSTVLLVGVVCVLLLLGASSLWYLRRKTLCCPLASEGGDCSSEMKEVCVLPPFFSQSETTIPVLGQSETTIPESDQPQTTIPVIGQSETTIPAIDVSETTIPAIDESETTIPAIDKSETTIPAIDESETTIPAIDESETTIPEDHQTEHITSN